MFDHTAITQKIKLYIEEYNEAKRKGSQVSKNICYARMRGYLDGIESCIGFNKVVELENQAQKLIIS